jgi:type I restriction enzyme M protein
MECLKPENNECVYDPTCGSAGMLLEAYQYMARNQKNPKSLRLFGQEKNLNTWAISQMNLFLHDIDDALVLRGDTILEPKHLEEGNSKSIKQFDVVVANPPFSLKSWGYEIWKSGDPYGRDSYGCPPKSYADYAFFQHMLKSLNSKGRMAVVMPLGVLFREGPERQIRVKIIESDVIEAIIALPHNLFYGADIPTCLFLINKEKSSRRGKSILFIDSSGNFQQELNRNILSNENIKKIVTAFHEGSEIQSYSRIVSHEEIVKNDFILNFGLYLRGESIQRDDLDHVIGGIVPSEVYAELAKSFPKDVLEKVLSKESPFHFSREFFSLSELRLFLSFLQPDEIETFVKVYEKYGISLNKLENHLQVQMVEIHRMIEDLRHDS